MRQESVITGFGYAVFPPSPSPSVNSEMEGKVLRCLTVSSRPLQVRASAQKGRLLVLNEPTEQKELHIQSS